MKIVHMGDFSEVINLLDELETHFQTASVEHFCDVKDSIKKLLPSNGIIIEASLKELKQMGGEMLAQEVVIKRANTL